MPELPEVESLLRGLRPAIVNDRIKKIEIKTPRILLPKPDLFPPKLEGRIISALLRHGKYLFLLLSDGVTVALHLRMTGQLTFGAGTIDRHTHLVIHLHSGQKLVYRDVRKFGRFTLLDSESMDDFILKRKLGPDALHISSEELWPRFRAKKRMLKALLLDQSFVAGLGNIYTDEILYASGHRPDKRSTELGRQQFDILIATMNSILLQAIANRGTTISDYRGSSGESGTHQFALKVYNRAQKPCPQCGTKIEKIRVAGRGTYICRNCQSA